MKNKFKKIMDRNKRVEADKARIILTIFTYLVIGIYLRAINITNPCYQH